MIFGSCQSGGLTGSIELLIPSSEIGHELLSNDVVTLEAELLKQGFAC